MHKTRGFIHPIVVVTILLVAIGVGVVLLLRGPRLKNEASVTSEPESIAAAESVLKDSSNLIFNSNNSKALEAAIIRNQQMTRLIQESPSTFLKYAIPEKVRNKLPAAVKNQVEQEVNLSGNLTVIVGDNFDKKTSKKNYFLTDANNNRYQINFTSAPENLTTGTALQVSGYKLDKNVAVNPSLENDPKKTVVVTSGPADKPQPRPRKVAVILFNFPDDKSKPWTKEQVKAWTFTDSDSTNAYYKATSFGKLSLVGKNDFKGDVYDWITIASQKGNICDPYPWSEQALSMLKAKTNMDGYDHYVFAFPTANCWFGGMAEIDGDTMWINGSYGWFRNGLVTHEFGHNFGAWHANTLYCTDSQGEANAFGPECTSQEYGDPFDVMGYINPPRQMNGYHKAQLGFLNPANMITVKQIPDVKQTFSVYPLEKASPGLQVVKIQRSRNVSGVGKNFDDHIYVDYRQPIEFWDDFNQNDAVVNGLEVRIGGNFNNFPYGSKANDLIDARPSTRYDWRDSSLALNQSVTDESRGITIKTIGLTKEKATFEVQYVKPKCVRANPKFEAGPVAQWGHPGEELYYYFVIENRDSYGCGRSTFTQTTSVLPGWQVNPQTTTLDIEPGHFAYGSFLVKPAISTANGYYTFNLKAINSNAPKFSSGVTLNYNIYTSDTTPPQVTIQSPRDGDSVLGSTVIINAYAWDNVQIISVDLFVDGLYRGQFGSGTNYYSLYWDTTKDNAGLHTISAKAFDKDGNSSQTKPITLNLKK